MENNLAIGYIRVSTDLQDNSLQVQEKRIREYCAFNKLNLVEILVDENVSGGTEILKRPSGRKLNDMGYIKDIVAIKPDRCFRSTKDALITTDEWNQNGITLHFADVSGSSLSTKTAIGRLMFTTIISFAEFERRTAGERTSVVLNNKKVNKNVYCGSIYGYNKIDSKLQPNLKELEIVKQIYEMKSGGFNDNQIATTLNGMNVTTKKGKLWQGSTVASILGNEIYLSLNK